MNIFISIDVMVIDRANVNRIVLANDLWLCC
jgi:hypothetical protein